MCLCVSSSLVRGPGVFGEVQVYWNITPAEVSEFESISGTVTMRDRQSDATIILKVDFFNTIWNKIRILLKEQNASWWVLYAFLKNCPLSNLLWFQALDDELPEVRRDFQLTLTSATPGLEISPTARHATVIMAASDNPHGLFSFTQRQIRATEEEGMVRAWK